MLSILRTLLQFILSSSHPHQACEPVHRDAHIPGTYYLYCVQTATSGTEVISVGHFAPREQL